MRTFLRCALAALSFGMLPSAFAAIDGTKDAMLPVETLHGDSLFPVPPQLQPAMKFWTDIYATYTSRQVVLHDPVNLQVVYEVLDFTQLYKEESDKAKVRRLVSDDVDVRRGEISELLNSLADRADKGDLNTEELSTDERRLFDSLAALPNDPNKFRSAAERVRAQTGQADEFARGVRDIGPYIGFMERVFVERGLPIQLSRLPFVESMFNLRARSHVGAAGPWQFMPSTGRRYMKIDAVIDERYDPIAATRAAARLFEHNFNVLGAWPVAVTAYNHGTTGMQRAITQLGTKDMGIIATQYESRSFGFASRNFYAEFLAAVHVYENRAHYFANSAVANEAAPAAVWDVVSLPDYVRLSTLASHCGISKEDLWDSNPSLSWHVFHDRKYVPKGFELRLPVGTAGIFAAAYDQIPPAERFATQRKDATHVVGRGETLSRIARRYGVSVSSLVALNNLRGNRIYSGQHLRVLNQAADTGEPTSSGGKVKVLAQLALTKQKGQPSAPSVRPAPLEPPRVQPAAAPAAASAPRLPAAVSMEVDPTWATILMRAAIPEASAGRSTPRNANLCRPPGRADELPISPSGQCSPEDGLPPVHY